MHADSVELTFWRLWRVLGQCAERGILLLANLLRVSDAIRAFWVRKGSRFFSEKRPVEDTVTACACRKMLNLPLVNLLRCGPAWLAGECCRRHSPMRIGVLEKKKIRTQLWPYSSKTLHFEGSVGFRIIKTCRDCRRGPIACKRYCLFSIDRPSA